MEKVQAKTSRKFWWKASPTTLNSVKSDNHFNETKLHFDKPGIVPFTRNICDLLLNCNWYLVDNSKWNSKSITRSWWRLGTLRSKTVNRIREKQKTEDQVIKGSCDFKGGNFLLEVTTQTSLVTIINAINKIYCF